MGTPIYIAPKLEEIGRFLEETNGYPWFKNRDSFGGRTFLY